MKRNILILTILLMSGFTVQTYAQSNREDKKKEKAAKKAAKMELDSINYIRLRAIIDTKAFVLEANTLYARTGQSYVLNSTTNFVGFDGINSTIQLSFNQIIGWNGVGGVTADGKISKMEVVENKKGLGFSINMTVKQQVGGAVNMVFRVSSDGNARVDMSGSFGEKFSFQGFIVPLSESSVYKGTTRY